MERRLKMARTAVLFNRNPKVQWTCFERVAEYAAECGDEAVFDAAHEQMRLLEEEVDRPRRLAILRHERTARDALCRNDQYEFDMAMKAIESLKE